jgi:DNA-directed RNA polymerase specialized sigma24 family protein
MPAPTGEEAKKLLNQAVAGDARSIRTLVDWLTPVIQARAARGLLKRRGTSGRDIRQEVEDLTQEVFVALFDSDGRALRAWDPERGMTLPNFIGLIAEREVSSILRSGRKSPWTESPTEIEDLVGEIGETEVAEQGFVSRETLATVFARAQEVLSPRGLELFHRLLVEEESVESVCKSTGMTPDAVYAWRSRLGKLIRQIAAEIERESGSHGAAVRKDDDRVRPRATRA